MSIAFSGWPLACAVDIYLLKPQHPQMQTRVRLRSPQNKKLSFVMQNVIISMIPFLRCYRFEIYLQIVSLRIFQSIRNILGFCWCIQVRTMHVGGAVFK